MAVVGAVLPNIALPQHAAYGDKGCSKAFSADFLVLGREVCGWSGSGLFGCQCFFGFGG